MKIKAILSVICGLTDLEHENCADQTQNKSEVFFKEVSVASSLLMVIIIIMTTLESYVQHHASFSNKKNN